VPAQLSASVALIVNVKVPAAVGVPETTPAEDKLRPVGNVPLLKVKV